MLAAQMRRAQWLLCLAIASMVSGPVAAQWLNYPDKTIPRTRDGKPNLTAPTPHVNGHPDLSGVWAAIPSPEIARLVESAEMPLGGDAEYVSKYALNVLFDVKPEDDPTKPELQSLFRQRMQGAGKDIPTSRCLPGGVPFSTLIAPFKIVHTPRLIVLLLEDNNPPRQIHVDGRLHLADMWPTWMGYSVGHWEHDVLVVDTKGFNDRSWLDAFGHPRSEAMHITERFHRRDVGHMNVAITFDDPKSYTRPFSMDVRYRLLPDTDVLESVCAENEKDRIHIDR